MISYLSQGGPWEQSENCLKSEDQRNGPFVCSEILKVVLGAPPAVLYPLAAKQKKNNHFDDTKLIYLEENGVQSTNTQMGLN